MDSPTVESTLNEETNDNYDNDDDDDDDEDDLFSMAVKELSETNRQADEIARVSICCYFVLPIQSNQSF